MQLRKYMIFGQYVLTFSMIYALSGPNVIQADEGEFPFIVAIVKMYPNYYGQRSYLCTASLITVQDILTADHCFEDETCEEIGVIMGSTDMTSEPNNGLKWWISFENWILNAGIHWKFRSNDISIGRLLHSVSKDWPIAKLKYMKWDDLQGKTGMAVAGGQIHINSFPRYIQKTKLRILSKPQCQNRVYKLTGVSRNFTFNHVCSIGDPYAVLLGGDSGSPLLYHNSIVGVNIGTTPPTDGINFHSDILNLHLNVCFYKDYIKSIIKIK